MVFSTARACAFCVIAFASTALSAQPDATSTSAETISFPANDLHWVEIPDTGGIKYANVSGDLTGKGTYEAFVHFPGGKANPFHHHTQALPTVVLKGTFYAIIDGKRTEYPAGSFYRLPAKLAHYSGCSSSEDCLLFQYQDDHFDMVPLKTAN
ncbi:MULTISPECIES: cupin domain-containing protein [Luteibacter]|uniref:Cupin domain-containing protein n=1 Tax=Luteibacter flocculans TaxID=2780091 RepID=A0ABY4TBL0_9GAMM|nr:MULTISPECIES: cupin domain-containing protein [Luteibacter]URL60091.1 cupin domain-containing protein [Luteibacter flocculans]SFW22795.1 Cupin domain-containing protein [Luteibacter sp. UNCMF366Tsu5.1]